MRPAAAAAGEETKAPAGTAGGARIPPHVPPPGPGERDGGEPMATAGAGDDAVAEGGSPSAPESPIVQVVAFVLDLAEPRAVASQEPAQAHFGAARGSQARGSRAKPAVVDDDEAVLEQLTNILGEDKLHYWSLVDQLLFCEDLRKNR